MLSGGAERSERAERKRWKEVERDGEEERGVGGEGSERFPRRSAALFAAIWRKESKTRALLGERRQAGRGRGAAKGLGGSFSGKRNRAGS